MAKIQNNILFIGNVYPTIHGVAEVSKKFIELFNNDIYKCTLLNTNFNKKIDSIERPSFFKITKLFYYTLKLIYVFLFNKISFVIVPISYNWNAFLKESVFIKISKFFGKKVIIYSHGLGFDNNFYDLQNEKKKKYIDGVFGKIYSVVVVTKKSINEFLKWVDEKKIHIIYNICNPVISLDSNIPNKKNDKILVLYMSLITENKGIFVLLDAFLNLVKKYSNIKLVICGSFWDIKLDEKEKFFNLIGKNELKDFIDFRGYVRNGDKVKAYLDSDIFVLPSLKESFGIVNIEAMSAGLPVVSTYQGAIPEYIKEGANGFLCRPGNTEELEEKLEMLIKDSSLRKIMSENNRQKFSMLFTSAKYIEKWKIVLEN